jgi:hypothetical protein
LTGWDVDGLRIIRRLAFGDEEYVRHIKRGGGGHFINTPIQDTEAETVAS